MDTLINLLQAIPTIEIQIGYQFRDKQLLMQSFVHRSYLNESRSIDRHNERLEFLGDAVLGLLAAEYLYLHYPSVPEGDLSFLRSRLVEAPACAQYVRQLNLEKHLLLGKGERLNDGKGRYSILADFLEALIGAIYLDGGLEATRHFLFDNFKNTIESILQAPCHNWKATLQDVCQKQHQATPTYVVVEATGPDHNKNFVVAVQIGQIRLGQGQGTSKKEAQQAAAKAALDYLESQAGKLC